MLPVIFRQYIGTDNNAGTIIALFPSNAGGIDETTCASYQYIGQHGPADYNLTMAQTNEAAPTKYKPLLKELRGLGYRGLKKGLRVYTMRRSKGKLEAKWLKDRRKQLQA